MTQTGTGETPKGRARGPGDVTFDWLFGSGSTASLTGVGGWRGPTPDQGDPAAALQQSIEESPEDGGGEGRGSGAAAPIVDVIVSVPTATDDWGDVVNPRAFIGAAARVVGAHATVLLRQALGAYGVRTA